MLMSFVQLVLSVLFISVVLDKPEAACYSGTICDNFQF